MAQLYPYPTHPTSTAFYLGTGKSWRIPSILNHLSRLILILKRMIWFPSDPLATIVFWVKITRYVRSGKKWSFLSYPSTWDLGWHPVCIGMWNPCVFNGWGVTMSWKIQRKTWDDMTLSYPWDGNGNRLEIPNVKWKHLHIFKVWTRKMFSGLEVAAPMQKKKTLTFHPTGCLLIGLLISWFIFFPHRTG